MTSVFSSRLSFLLLSALLLGGCAGNRYGDLTITPEERVEIESLGPAGARDLGEEHGHESAERTETRTKVVSAVWHGGGALFTPVGYALAWWLFPEGSGVTLVSEDTEGVTPAMLEYGRGWTEAADREVRRNQLWGKLVGGLVGTTIFILAGAAGS